MTTLTPGDIVLRDGRAEEVHAVGTLTIGPPISVYWPKQQSQGYRISDATPLGINTRDGWRVHTGSERPEGVGADDQFEVVWPSKNRNVYTGHILRNAWIGVGHLIAYRPVHVANAAVSALDREAETCSRSDRLDRLEQNAQTTIFRDPEVLKVAEEMRERVRDGETFAIWPFLSALADRLDPPAPNPLKVGDRVRWKSADMYASVEAEIRAVDGASCLLRVEGQLAPSAGLASDMELVR